MVLMFGQILNTVPLSGLFSGGGLELCYNCGNFYKTMHKNHLQLYATQNLDIAVELSQSVYLHAQLSQITAIVRLCYSIRQL